MKFPLGRWFARSFLDWRIAVAAFIVTGAAFIASPSPALAANCGPGSEPTTGCTNCGWEVPGFFPCGCCTDAHGNPTCLWCAVE